MTDIIGPNLALAEYISKVLKDIEVSGIFKTWSDNQRQHHICRTKPVDNTNILIFKGHKTKDYPD